MHDIEFPGGVGRWAIPRRTFWQGGDPHELVVLSDVSQPWSASAAIVTSGPFDTLTGSRVSSRTTRCTRAEKAIGCR